MPADTLDWECGSLELAGIAAHNRYPLGLRDLVFTDLKSTAQPHPVSRPLVVVTVTLVLRAAHEELSRGNRDKFDSAILTETTANADRGRHEQQEELPTLRSAATLRHNALLPMSKDPVVDEESSEFSTNLAGVGKPLPLRRPAPGLPLVALQPLQPPLPLPPS